MATIAPYTPSVSLAGSAQVFYMGLATKGIHKDMFGLWWQPIGPDWTGAHVRAARQVFFDVCELDVQSAFPMHEG
eukprot:1297407-Pyramimonas_sp.AAC.1